MGFRILAGTLVFNCRIGGFRRNARRMISHIRRIKGQHFKPISSISGFTVLEHLVLLVLGVSLLWMALPIVFVHYGIIEAADVVKTQPILHRVPTSGEVQDKGKDKDSSPPESSRKPVLPPSLERVTQGFGVELPEIPKK